MNEAEVLLKHAVNAIVNDINNGGMPAHDAVVKVAKELDLNPNLIKRASEVINVALHYNHFKKNANAKAEDFPIVDAIKVAEEIFGIKDKTSAQYKSENFPSNEYNDVIPNFNKFLTDPKFKAAHNNILNAPEEAKAIRFPMSAKGVMDKSANYIQRLEKELDDVKTKLAGAKFDYNRKICSILEKFARDDGYRTSFGEFESQVYSIHGDKALPYVDLIYKTGNIKEKRGEHDTKYEFFDTCDEAKTFSEFLKSAKEFLELEEQVKVAEYNLKFEKDFLTESYHARGKELFKDAGTPRSIVQQLADEDKNDSYDPVIKSANKKVTDAAYEKEEINKEASKILDMVMNKYKQESEPGSEVPSVQPERNLDRKLMVQELMSTDPIISTSDPRRVAGAYEQMLHISPEISNEKEIVRSMLRTMLSSQALGPHDAQQLIEANTKLFQQKMMQEGKFQGSPKPPKAPGA